MTTVFLFVMSLLGLIFCIHHYKNYDPNSENQFLVFFDRDYCTGMGIFSGVTLFVTTVGLILGF